MLSPSLQRIFSQGKSLVRFKRKHGINPLRFALLTALSISFTKLQRNPSLSAKNARVLAMREFWTDLRCPWPLVFNHAIAHPCDAQAQTLCPLKLAGAKCMPRVMNPKRSPFMILALPLVNNFISIFLSLVGWLEWDMNILAFAFKPFLLNALVY